MDFLAKAVQLAIDKEKIDKTTNDMINKEDDDNDDEDDDDEDEVWNRDDLDKDEYYVEKILQRGIRDGETQYYVKWRDYPKDESTWETIDNLQNSMEFLRDFEQLHGEKRAEPNDKKRTKALKAIIASGSRTTDMQRIELKIKREEFVRDTTKRIVDVVGFYTNKKTFLVKWNNDRVSELSNAEYEALPYETKRMFVEFLDRNRRKMILEQKNKYLQDVERLRQTTEQERAMKAQKKGTPGNGDQSQSSKTEKLRKKPSYKMTINDNRERQETWKQSLTAFYKKKKYSSK